MKNPSYRIRFRFVSRLCFDILLGRKRSFRKDGTVIATQMGVPLGILGDGFIPPSGPGLVVFNHYSREGFSIIYAVAAIASAIPVDMHWIMTGAWTFPGRPFARHLRKISEWVFRQIARVYGFTLTPPLPPDPEDQPARTAGVREVFQHIKEHPACLIALAPEGRDFPGSMLGEPPPGSGKFLLELSRRLGMVHPVGVFEENNSLVISFGQPFDLYSIIDKDTADLDHEAARMVMKAIAALLPKHLAGSYNP